MTILAAPMRRSLENPNVPISAYQLADIWGGGPTRAGVQVNEKTALTYMAVYTAVKVISESLGMLPLKVLCHVDEDRVNVVRDRPESYMLGMEANPEQSAAVFKECLQAWQCLWGNCYARILDGKTTKQLLPLRSDRVHPERKGGDLVYRVEGASNDGISGPAQTFYPEEIIHLPGLSMNGISGLSPIGVAREAVATGKAQEIFTATFYGNGTNLGGTLTHPGKLKPETKTAIKESWNNSHQGVANAHRVAILDEGVKYEPMGMPLTDAQFLETRKFQVIEIARLYRVPPHMLMDLDRSTNNNIEQQSLEFVMYCLGPWIEKWEQEFSRKLFGVGSELCVGFDLTRLLMADMAAQQQFYTSGRQWGYLSANDVRRRLNLNPIPDGDQYLVASNMMPVDKAHPLIDSQIKKNNVDTSKTPAKTDKNGQPLTAAAEAGLNGAQITAAVDIVGKLRSGTIAGEAAIPLLVALGIPEDQAQAIAKASPARGTAEADKQFLQELTKALAGNAATVGVVANTLNVTQTVKGAGAPTDPTYKTPWLPVVAQAGDLVTGETIKDADGDVVGADVEETTEGTENTEPTKAKEMGERARLMAGRLFAAALKRMVKKETNALATAASKSDFAAAAEKFYRGGGGHQGHLTEALAEPAEAIAVLLGKEARQARAIVAAFAAEACGAVLAHLPAAGDVDTWSEERNDTYPAWASEKIAATLGELWK